MPHNPEPLHLVGAVTPDFRRVLARLRDHFEFAGELNVRNGAPLRLDVDGAGVAIRADENSDVVVTVPWTSLGKPGEHPLAYEPWTLRVFLEEVANVIASFLRIYGSLEPSRARLHHPVLHLPVSMGDEVVDLDVSVNATWGVAREVEQRRPRPAYGKAAPWA